MNFHKVKEIIDFYKSHFDDISKEEIYKWRAIRHFQDNWSIDAGNFIEMLENSFKRSRNLLSSGNYYPLRMLHLNAGKEPETVRAIFRDLYDEERDLVERVTVFRRRITVLNSTHFPDKKQTYQDTRAVLAYLCFRYPDRYFFYKYEMFRDFAEKVEYPCRPKMGRDENIIAFLKLCTLVRAEIVKDKDVLALHKRRLTEEHFFDTSYNILTQDVIYAAVKHFERFEQQVARKSALERLQTVERTFLAKSHKIVLKGRFINHIENELRNKRIGNRGELLVFEYEQEKLRKLGSKNEPRLIAQTNGDGEGYDILSFDELNEEMFIEVKTTKYSCHAPFYITRHELEKSRNEKERFYLYRLYNFDEREDAAKCYIQRGSLEILCIYPVLYKVILEEAISSEKVGLPSNPS